jgi:hypothetical protein
VGIFQIHEALDFLAKYQGATNTRINQFTGDKTGNRKNVAPHINKHSNPASVFMLHFAAVITLMVEQTNQYYRQYLDTLDNGPSHRM